MPLSWNEIRSRAHEFSKRWENESSERAEAQSFWNEFFSVFGIERRRVAVFEKQVEITRAGQKLKHGRIQQRCATGGVFVRALPATHQPVAG